MRTIRAYIDGTAGGTDGTLSPILFVNINTPVEVMFRCFEVERTHADVVLTAPSADYEVSADGVEWGPTANIGVVGLVNTPGYVRWLVPIPGGRPATTLLRLDAILPEQVTGLVGIASAEEFLHVDLTWDGITDDANTAEYELQRRTEWKILALGADEVWEGSETLISQLQTRFGSVVLDEDGMLTLSGEAFVSFSGDTYEDVTFTDVEVSATYVSGQASLVMRSDNGAGPNGWHAYVAVINPDAITIHISDSGVLSAPIASVAHTTATGERVAFRAQATFLTVRIDGVAIAGVYDSTFANGVVGFGSVSGVSAWDMGITDFQRIMSPTAPPVVDLNVDYGIRCTYRTRAVDTWEWVGAWSNIAQVDIDLEESSPTINETITVAFGELSIVESEAPPEFSDPITIEALTAALSDLAIVELEAPDVPIGFADSLTASLSGLSIVELESPLVPLSLADSLTASLSGMSILDIVVEQVPARPVESVTASLSGLTITLTNI